MIIVEILGGLGNQLFEYAHARSLSVRLKKDLQFDLNFFDRYYRSDVYRLDKFKTQIKIADAKDIHDLRRYFKKPDIYRKVINRLGFSQYLNNKNHFDNKRIDNLDISDLKKVRNLYISGYFADEKYFKENEELIKKEFTLSVPLNSVNQKMISQINTSNSVSLHIRRGDYVGNSYFAELPMDFYKTAINYLETKQKNLTYFIFSDDQDWVKKNLKLDVKCVFVDINESSTDYMELILMATCNHNIIANSTFSWWGAWLNNNSDKIVIAPKVWFNNKMAQQKYNSGNLVPANWIKI